MEIHQIPDSPQKKVPFLVGDIPGRLEKKRNPDLGGVDLHGCHLHQLFNQFLPSAKVPAGLQGASPSKSIQFLRVPK